MQNFMMGREILGSIRCVELDFRILNWFFWEKVLPLWRSCSFHFGGLLHCYFMKKKADHSLCLGLKMQKKNSRNEILHFKRFSESISPCHVFCNRDWQFSCGRPEVNMQGSVSHWSLLCTQKGWHGFDPTKFHPPGQAAGHPWPLGVTFWPPPLTWHIYSPCYIPLTLTALVEDCTSVALWPHKSFLWL